MPVKRKGLLCAREYKKIKIQLMSKNNKRTQIMTTEVNNCHSIYIFEEKMTRKKEAGRMLYKRGV